MTDRVQEAMKDVWTWKREAEEATRGMDSAQLIEFYRRQAQDVPADGIAHFYGCCRPGKITGISRVFEVIEDRIVEHIFSICKPNQS